MLLNSLVNLILPKLLFEIVFLLLKYEKNKLLFI